MSAIVRRVVTGLDDSGRSCVLVDDKAPGFVWTAEPGSHPGGSRFLISELQPRAEHGGWHATNTIDYVVVTEGEVVLGLEAGDVTLRTGDTLVQGGVMHAWRNDTAVPARIAVVMLDAEPVRA